MKSVIIHYIITDPYHNSEGVVPHGLMVQALSGVQDACPWVQPELPEAERVSAAQEREGQLVLLVFIRGTDPQDLCLSRGVLRDTHLVSGLRELWPVVVGVYDTDKHLLES